MVWSQKALDKKHMDLYPPVAGKTTPKLRGNSDNTKLLLSHSYICQGSGVALSVPRLGESSRC